MILAIYFTQVTPNILWSEVHGLLAHLTEGLWYRAGGTATACCAEFLAWTARNPDTSAAYS